MMTAFAVLLLALALLAWGGQLASVIAPALTVCGGLMEAESAVDPVCHADIRTECVWDALTLWPPVAAAVLLLFRQLAWSVFGLIGGGMFVYFAGRGITHRIVMTRHGIAIGTPTNVRSAFALIALWGVVAVTTIVVAAAELLG